MKTLPNQKTQNLGLFVDDITEEQAANVRRWIDDLRSGKYKQAQHSLKKDGGYCCLGVAHCVALGRKANDMGGLPQESMDDLGVQCSLGDMKNGKSLAALNDSLDWTFQDIAQLLEDQLNLVVQP